jgi:ATP/maltotriose-dependent transcriptional regulator MalT
MIMKLIASKITIPIDTPRVCRQGLLDTLRENLESCYATVIDGRAGTGKTMLAADARGFVARILTPCFERVVIH